MTVLTIALLLLNAGTTPALTGSHWKAGFIEAHTYKLGEQGIPGSATYTMRGVIREHKLVLEVEMETHRVLTLGGQQGKLEGHRFAWMDPETFNLLETRMLTTMNGVEASYLHTIRKGNKFEVYQQLRGTPADTKQVDAPDVAIDESAENFYLSRLKLTPGAQYEWKRYNAAQSGFVLSSAKVEKVDAQQAVVGVKTDIGVSTYEVRLGTMPYVTRVVTAGTEQLKIEESTSKP